MAYARKGQKLFNKAKRYAKKRYTRKGAGYGTGVRLGKLRQDIALIKRSLNTEKKYIDTGEVASTDVGQCSVNAVGNFVKDITPAPSVGTGFSNRIGKSIKVVAMSLDYQIVQQSACAGNRRFKLYVGTTVGEPQSALGANSIQTDFMQINPITTMYDYMSNRDVNFMSRYKVLAVKTIYLKSDSLANQQMIATGKCVMKLNHHIQFDDNTTTVTNGQLWYYIVADAGNAGSTNSTLSNVAVTTASTGGNLQTYSRFWYVDN